MSVLWNEEKNDYLVPIKVLRQWDSISSCLFVLCIDKLSHMIIEIVDRSEWESMKAGRSGSVISHLMFADDVPLFWQSR